MKTIYRSRELFLFLCFFLLSLGAHAGPSPFSYSLPGDQGRLEVQIDKNEGGSVKLLLYRKHQTNPLVLALADPSGGVGKSSIDGKSRKYIFPAPSDDFDTSTLPDWIELSFSEPTRKSLTERGILIIEDHTASDEFVHAFPLLVQADQAVDAVPQPYFFRQEPRIESILFREFSAAFVESAGLPDAPEANLLMSILDMNHLGVGGRLGTVILRKDGRFQHQDLSWEDFSENGSRYEFQRSDRPGVMNILVDGKIWGRPVASGNKRNWQTRWPLYEQLSLDLTASPEQLEKVAENRRKSELAKYEAAVFLKQPLPTQDAYQRFIKRIEDGAPDLQKREAEELEQEFAQLEPKLKSEMDFANELLQRSGLANELARAQEAIVEYQLKDYPSSSSDVRFVVLSVRTVNKRSTRKTTNRIFSIDSRSHRILEQYKIPRAYTSKDFAVLPSGQVYLKNGKIIYLTSKARANKCADIFRK